ncbi:LuxR C-terminal-related transcriptional regulator [Desulfosporosinus sp. OT]|uniref:LuxR C-terminal-related transcriptional regulator n=1 Tax=Desulfosporosinus sp. OT TaxID=913865 RepID=UPI0002239DCA|nr:LuxR C-terminal-related transcriptional regulator [Desulfosporosinus sp. OT]EGW41507.1 bacterial regulatory s, luxR family protein [Desulfosporosinus sp. OT]
MIQKPKKNITRNLYFPKRITDAIKEAINYPLTIVEAPMGYGKTTAVRELLRSDNVNLMWLRVHDSSLSSLWNVFCRQLGEVDYNRSLSLAALGFPSDSTSRQEALNLIEDMELKNKAVLVIDDYHIVECPELNGFIEFLVMNEITDLHLVLTARHTGLQRTEELILKGYLLHIEKEVFEFSDKDIKAYYRLCGIFLKKNEAERLYALTEGWISALYLIMLNYIENGILETLQDINKLLENTIYRHFPEEIKELLQSLCLLDSFSLEQAVYVSNNENSETLLSEVIANNAFIKYDEGLKTYHMHKIFTRYLRHLLEGRETGFKRQLYRRMAEFSMGNGDYVEAMENFYRAEEFESLLLAVEADQGHSIHNEQREAFVRYFEDCPKVVFYRHPTAVLIYALCLFSFNEMERFQQVCGGYAETVQGNEHLEAESLDDLMGEFELLLSFTEYNNLQKMYEHIKRAAELLNHPAKFMDTKSSWTFGSPSVLYMFYRERGTLSDDVKTLKEAMPVYSRLTNGHGTGSEFVMGAERHFNCGDFESAEIEVQKALYAANRYSQGDIVFCAMFLQARLAIIKGDYSNTLYILQKMHEELNRKRWYNLMHTIELCDAFVHACLKRVERIPLWIKERDLDSSRLYFPVKVLLNIVYGRVLLVDGEYLKILGASEEFLGEASVFPNLLGQIYAYIYISAANEKIFRRTDALEALKKAMDLAVVDEVYLPFVENCDFIKPLLEELDRKGSFREDIGRILDISNSYQTSILQIMREHFQENRPALTEREMEIVQLAVKGLTNKEIGERLFITANTVKTALKSVYGKLSINNRALLEQHFTSL